MNRQEIFDTVATHLRKQGNRSIRRMGDDVLICAYRSDNGKGCKCAIGCLIPDDLYNPEMEGKPVTSLIKISQSENPPFKVPDWFAPNEDLLYNLQKVHDLYLSASWERVLKDTADQFDLEYKCP